MIRAGGARQLAVGDLRANEVAELAWSGSPAHLRNVAAALQRAAQGREDYLVVRAPGGEPVAKMRIDYTSEADTGVFSQLATMGPLQGRASPPCSSARASSASMPAAWRSPRSASKTTTPGTPPLPAARLPVGRPPARIMGNRGRHRRPPGVRNHAHDSAQAPLTPERRPRRGRLGPDRTGRSGPSFAGPPMTGPHRRITLRDGPRCGRTAHCRAARRPRSEPALGSDRWATLIHAA